MIYQNEKVVLDTLGVKKQVKYNMELTVEVTPGDEASSDEIQFELDGLLKRRYNNIIALKVK